jgi:predicted DsbA family dithiol-disulfide isomerase
MSLARAVSNATDPARAAKAPPELRAASLQLLRGVREMLVALMKAPANAYTPANLEMIAQSVGLDIARWKKDMADANLIKRVDRSVEEFDMAGLQGTPSFLINGRFVGGFGQEELESLIEATRQQIRS